MSELEQCCAATHDGACARRTGASAPHSCMLPPGHARQVHTCACQWSWAAPSVPPIPADVRLRRLEAAAWHLREVLTQVSTALTAFTSTLIELQQALHREPLSRPQQYGEPRTATEIALERAARPVNTSKLIYQCGATEDVVLEALTRELESSKGRLPIATRPIYFQLADALAQERARLHFELTTALEVPERCPIHVEGIVHFCDACMTWDYTQRTRA